MITELEYKALREQHELACRRNDYSKMIMNGDDNWKKLNEYEREFVCKHTRIIELQGGQIERCADCGKECG